jgi:tRNA(Ile)-lysidine synthase
MSAPPREVADTRRAVRLALADLGAADLVLVACSGGADSLALAAATAWEADRHGWRAGAVTVDHGLQEGSAERAAAVVHLLSGLGLDPVESVRVEVAPGSGPEEAARRARYGALDEVADRLGARVVLLAHTRDDQAETVLLRLARGSGARSLAGMPRRSGRYLRPFLSLSREDVRAAATLSGLASWEDPHNSDRSFLRPRVRHDVLPALERALGGDVAAALARSADLLRADADALDLWADRVSDDVLQVWPDAGDPAPGVLLDVEALAGVPEAVRTRVLRRAALAAGCSPGALGAAHVRAVSALIDDWRGQGAVALPGGVFARRHCGRLLLRRGPDTARGTIPIEETRGR